MSHSTYLDYSLGSHLTPSSPHSAWPVADWKHMSKTNSTAVMIKHSYDMNSDFLAEKNTHYRWAGLLDAIYQVKFTLVHLFPRKIFKGFYHIWMRPSWTSAHNLL